MSILKLSSPKINVQVKAFHRVLYNLRIFNINDTADKLESEFIAWIIYSCDGGGKDESNFDKAGMNNYFSIFKELSCKVLISLMLIKVCYTEIPSFPR